MYMHVHVHMHVYAYVCGGVLKHRNRVCGCVRLKLMSGVSNHFVLYRCRVSHNLEHIFSHEFS